LASEPAATPLLLAVPPSAREALTSAEARWSAIPLAIVVGAEVAFVLGGLQEGAAASSLALVALLTLGALRRGRPGGSAAIALATIPLLRVLSIALPSLLVPVWLWYAEIGLLVILATMLAARMIPFDLRALVLRPVRPADTLLAAGAGLPLGLLAMVIAGTPALGMDRSFATLLLASVAVIVGGALAEELLFRGLVQGVAEGIVPRGGVAVAAGLSTLLYLATLNLRYVVLMAAVAVVLGMLTRRSGSIVPAVACHAALLWSQVILWPALLG